MYQTHNFPVEKPMMLWDGNCGFCQFWIKKWKRITGDKINYYTFQEKMNFFPDIPDKVFREAVCLIKTDGYVLEGAEAALTALAMAGRYCNVFNLYKRSDFFKKLSDWVYNFISRNRPFFYRLTVFFFGKRQ